MRSLQQELQEVLETVRSQHDVIPFLERIVATDSICIAPMSEPMISLLGESSDYAVPSIGTVTWLQIAAPQGQAELVVYRSHADGELYVVAPEQG